jgi:hypothetical protein
MRSLSLAAESRGVVLDLSGCIRVRTPGNPDRQHGPGWHLWYRAPKRPCALGPVDGLRAAEIKGRATAPGSPGYAVSYVPQGKLARLPAWIAELAGVPRERPERGEDTPGAGGDGRNRLEGAIGWLREARKGERNYRLFCAAFWLGEMRADGQITTERATEILMRAADAIDLVRDDGKETCLASIQSGLDRAS